MDIKSLEQHLTPFISLIKDSGVEYFWIAGGAIRDYFVTGGTSRDIDIWFPDKESRNIVIKYLKLCEFKSKKLLPRDRGETFSLIKKSVPQKYIHLAKGLKYNYHSMDIGNWDGKTGESKCYATTPEECINMFDFSIEMSALDSNGSFFCHPTFENDMNNKILNRNSRPHGYPRQSNRRLLKYIKDGFTIDHENLLLWLENQEASFEYRRRLKNK